jgi:hypothetical protein
MMAAAISASFRDGQDHLFAQRRFRICLGRKMIDRRKTRSCIGDLTGRKTGGLPSVAANYLAQTYPNYTFKKAFSFSLGGTLKGYVVFLDANNTKYAVEFDAAGNFLRAKAVH